MNHVHDLTILNRILERGLCNGGGDGVSTFCAEQAVAAVCGLPITDRPDECVTPSVSAYGRAMNDSNLWPSDRARAVGMRDFLIAQIGSKGVVDGVEFAKRLALATVRRVLPPILRANWIAEPIVLACERAEDLTAAWAAARDSASAAARAASDAAWAASDAAWAAASAAARDAASAAASAAARAASAAARDAASYAALYESLAIAVEILRDLKSPGCELLEVSQ